jgi:hypothetical protein
VISTQIKDRLKHGDAKKLLAGQSCFDRGGSKQKDSGGVSIQRMVIVHTCTAEQQKRVMLDLQGSQYQTLALRREGMEVNIQHRTAVERTPR